MSRLSTGRKRDHVWEKFEQLPNGRGPECREWLQYAEKRYNNSVPASWFAAHVLHPRYTGEDLTASEMKKALEWIDAEYPTVKGDYLTFLGDSRATLRDEFAKTPNCKAKSFIRAQTALGVISDELSRLSLKLMSLAPSSAGIERAFSTMGYVEGDLRNSLSSEKTEKLAFCMRCLKK